MCTQKMRALSYLGAEKITFPPKSDRHTDRHTYRRTDISVYRVASLLKKIIIVANLSFKSLTLQIDPFSDNLIIKMYWIMKYIYILGKQQNFN